MRCTHRLKIFDRRSALSAPLALFSWTVICALFTLNHRAWGRAFRLSQLPNSARLQCTVCHLDPLGGPVNAFGLDAQSTFRGESVDWPRLCPLDSDGDGWRNGEELGDARCRWREGLAEPRFPPSDPSDPSVTPETVLQPPVDQGSPLDRALDRAQVIDDLGERRDQDQRPSPDRELTVSDGRLREQRVDVEEELDHALDAQTVDQDRRLLSPDQRGEQAERVTPERPTQSAESGCHFMTNTPAHPLLVAFLALILLKIRREEESA